MNTHLFIFLMLPTTNREVRPLFHKSAVGSDTWT
jgi:hypothetical protein